MPMATFCQNNLAIMARTSSCIMECTFLTSLKVNVLSCLVWYWHIQAHALLKRWVLITGPIEGLISWCHFPTANNKGKAAFPPIVCGVLVIFPVMLALQVETWQLSACCSSAKDTGCALGNKVILQYYYCTNGIVSDHSRELNSCQYERVSKSLPDTSQFCRVDNVCVQVFSLDRLMLLFYATSRGQAAVQWLVFCSSLLDTDFW